MITVLGAGAFGTSLAISLARKKPVLLWARDKAQVDMMQRERCNGKRLSGALFPDGLSVTHQLEDLPNSGPILLAVPMQMLRSFAEEHKSYLDGRMLVATCKGIDIKTFLGPVETLEAILPRATIALLTGPSFAQDIAHGLPTALSLACKDTAAGENLQQYLSTDTLRLYRTEDTIGAELGGALKNVVAIATGAADGAGLGASARAALMTRGFAEMQRLALKRGARAETLTGLSGFGDLTLTCTSELSRNYRLGQALGRGESFDSAVTVEGVATAQAIAAWSKELEIELPICASVHELCQGKMTVSEALQALLSRPLKEE